MSSVHRALALSRSRQRKLGSFFQLRCTESDTVLIDMMTASQPLVIPAISTGSHAAEHIITEPTKPTKPHPKHGINPTLTNQNPLFCRVLIKNLYKV